tara:strand:+ start:551 stop:811 length:261 start_codon:yes stop_codon:yes gene_type:complete
MRILTNNARVLLAVLENPDMNQRQISRLLGMHYQHVWRALDRLVKEGILVKRRRDRRTFFKAAEGFYELEDIKRLNACLTSDNVLH